MGTRLKDNDLAVKGMMEKDSVSKDRTDKKATAKGRTASDRAGKDINGNDMLDEDREDKENTEYEQRPKKRYALSILAALLIVVLASVGFLSFYPRFQRQAADFISRHREDVMVNEAFLRDIYESNSVLYKQLQEQVTGENFSYHDLYLSMTKEPSHGASGYTNYGNEDGTEYAGRMMDEMLRDWESTFWNSLNISLDYQITDLNSGKTISNTGNDIGLLGSVSAPETLDNQYPYYIKLRYDDSGFLEYVWVRSVDGDSLLKNVQRVMKSNYLERCFLEHFSSDGYSSDDISSGNIYYYYNGETMQAKVDINGTPKNCTICYALTEEQKANLEDIGMYQHEVGYWEAYMYTGIQDVFRILLLILGLASLILPFWKKYHLHELWIFQFHAEILLAIVLILFWWMGDMAAKLVMFTMECGNEHAYIGMIDMIKSYLPDLSMEYLEMAAMGINILLLTLMFAFWYLLMTGFGQIHVLGVRGYIRERSICYRILHSIRSFCRRKTTQFKEEVLHVDLGQNINRTLLKLVIVNYLILALLSMLWFAGAFILVIYSIILYLAVRKYIRHIQNQYSHLLAATQSIADGDLQTEFTDDWGIFESYKSQLAQIQEGFSRAVEEEVKSQRMRTELITNVSHDLKTPLTAITTYIELLQEEGVTPEQQKEYLDVLARKALRLKTLIEDLFEVSKASSGNVSFQLEKVDIGNLMRQAYLEYEDKIEEADLIFRFYTPEEKQFIMLDSQKTYRIFENLYTNIIKYAMPHTRVYVNMDRQGEDVVIELKNMSRAELNIAPESLTERFVRGDSSRNTEGSGLGLAIARSFVELQKGKMQVTVDGDLFKVTILWKGL